MRSSRAQSKIALIAIGFLLLGGVGYYLLRADADSRAQQRTEFGHRAALAANLITATLAANLSDPSDLHKQFGGSPAEVTEALAADQRQTGDPLAAVYDGNGRLLAAWPGSAARLTLNVYAVGSRRR